MALKILILILNFPDPNVVFLKENVRTKNNIFRQAKIYPGTLAASSPATYETNECKYIGSQQPNGRPTPTCLDDVSLH